MKVLRPDKVVLLSTTNTKDETCKVKTLMESRFHGVDVEEIETEMDDPSDFADVDGS